MGHIGKDRFKKQNDFKEKKSNEGNVVVAYDKLQTDNGMVLVNMEKSQNQQWILDSGCSFHMCHIEKKGLKSLQNKGVLGKVNIGKFSNCEQCLIGKQIKLLFPTKTHKTRQILEYLHPNL